MRRRLVWSRVSRGLHQWEGEAVYVSEAGGTRFLITGEEESTTKGKERPE